MKKIFFISFIWLANIGFSIAQNPVIDSLTLLVKKAPNDSVKFLSLINLSYAYKNVDTLKAWGNFNLVMSMAKKSKKNLDLGMAHELDGALNTFKNPQKAIESFEKAMSYLEKDKYLLSSIRSQISIKNNLGIIHFNNSDFQGALQFFLDNINLYEKYDHKNNKIINSLSNTAVVYGYLKNSDAAIVYAKKALGLAEKSGKKQGILSATLSMGNALNSGKEPEKAIEYIEKAIKIASELNDKYFLWSSYSSLGVCHYKLKQFQNAKIAFEKTLKIQKESKDNSSVAQTYISLAASYSGLKELNLAKRSLDSSKKYFDIKPISYQKQIYYETLVEIFDAEKNFKKASQYKDTITVLRDSLYNRENIRKLEFVNARFQNNLKQSRIFKLETQKTLQATQLKQKTTNNYLLIGGLSTLAIVSLLGFWNYKNRQRLDKQRIVELETKQQLTATEAVLKGEEQERTRLAKDLHDGLGGMLSGIKHSFASIKGNMVMTSENSRTFQRSLDMVDNSIKEMRRVAHNMMPEALVKFGLDAALKDYCGDINDSGALQINYKGIGIEKDQIDQSKAIAIYRIIQELTNNIIKHAKAKSAIVQVINTDNKLNITIEDDGVGFDKAILNNIKGIGWANIYNRVEFLKGTIEV
jgi:two-component system, NarL family, sensor kinase